MPATHIGRIPWTRESGPGLLNTIWSAAVDDAIAAAGWLRRANCRLGGHDMLLQFEPDRLSLRCHNCGEQTPGWAIGH